MEFTNLKQKLVKVEVVDQIIVLTIDHPPVNALNADAIQELDQAIERIRKENNCRALIITGSGDKSFVAGADIKEFTSLDKEKAIRLSEKGQAIFTKIADLEMPVICAIKGYVLGAGFELALACDIRIADDSMAVRKAKKAIDSAAILEMTSGFSMEAHFFGELCETEDKDEGVRAFLDKDNPVFTGK
jgi:enoyl-CoA hydratase/carnithine racemase